MKIIWSDKALKQYYFWEKNDQNKATKIKKLIIDIKQHPFDGIGKPEILKKNLSGYWSRRINQEHRLVYKVEDSVMTIISCRYHY